MCVILTFNGLAIIKIYSTDHYGPEMYKIYRKNNVMVL